MQIAVVYAGGTIGCVGQPMAPMPRERFMEAVAPTRLLPVDTAFVPFGPAIDSSAATPDDWLRLARAVIDASQNADGVMVLHGTDTLAWTASALAFLTTEMGREGAVARLSAPIAVCGSMRPLFIDTDGSLQVDPASDASENLRRAVLSLAIGASGTQTVVGHPIPATRTMKLHTTDDAAFAMPNGPANLVDAPDADPARLLAQCDGIAAHLGARPVLTYAVTPAAPETHVARLDALIDAGPPPGALILLGTGTGNLPENAVSAGARRVLEADGIVVLGTQVAQGPSHPGLYATGSGFSAAAILSMDDMTIAAVETKLQILLALAAQKGWSRADIIRLFETSLAGERTPEAD